MLLLALALACHPDPVDSADDTPRERRPWTVAVFMDGDNDLERYVLHDLNELEQVTTEEAWVVVQADRAPGWDERDGDWTGTRRYEIHGDDDLDVVHSPVVADLGERDMGDPAELAEFLAWVDDVYPSDRLAVVLWDHGDGWPAAMISWDVTSRSTMSIARGELRAGLAPTVAARGPIDLVAFDGCNMNGFEVAHSLRDQARVLSASEAWVGWAGLQYGPALELLDAEPDTDPLELGDALARDATSVGENTWAAVDLDRMDALAAALDDVADAWLADPDGIAAFRKARARADSVDRVWHDWYVDLGSLLALAPAAPPAEAAYADALVGSYVGADRFPFATGMTVFTATDDPSSLHLYRTGAGATWADGRWDDLLAAVARSESGL